MGFIMVLLAIPLLITGNHWAQRKLGKYWKRLQRLTYVIWGLLACHLFCWKDSDSKRAGDNGSGSPVTATPSSTSASTSTRRAACSCSPSGCRQSSAGSPPGKGGPELARLGDRRADFRAIHIRLDLLLQRADLQGDRLFHGPPERRMTRRPSSAWLGRSPKLPPQPTGRFRRGIL